jgi:hypothetical protein
MIAFMARENIESRPHKIKEAAITAAATIKVV